MTPVVSECGCSPSGRALVVCIDGTANQFSVKVSIRLCLIMVSRLDACFTFQYQNSNVVGFYSRVIKDDNQLTYYDSGIGTYVKPSARFSRVWQKLYNFVDMAVAL
jgi:uncharacterized protein (DUF2235 family)